ncbi:diacylglycerol kinase family lipid kinase [Flavobacterium zepuense]|uniref:Diacylglycerol kinase family lipid kinase n=1 Tax=Flavobacterium zepuense TaxID=2593302 RepID=A0A552V1D8_9FLAO|nr:diacylglycerol kinase family lipid kinase [Flavobacterium zepuense]
MYLHFIVNPISGKADHTITKDFLQEYFPEGEHTIVVEYSEYKKHSTVLTQGALQNNPDCIVACGGDGTINEVASCLVGTKVTLGIVPVGSGNGLAANLGIPLNIDAALKLLQAGKQQQIDVGHVSGHYFFSNMGLGIDALIIKNYEEAKRRTLSAYVKASIKSALSYKLPHAIISVQDKVLTVNPFILFISNSNQMGYGMSLTPNASLLDGKLDVLIVPKINFLKKLYFGLLVFIKETERFKQSTTYLAENVIIELPYNIFTDVQIDGEYHFLKTNVVTVSVLPKSLTVIIG